MNKKRKRENLQQKKLVFEGQYSSEDNSSVDEYSPVIIFNFYYKKHLFHFYMLLEKAEEAGA